MCGKLDYYLKQLAVLKILEDTNGWKETANLSSPGRILLLFAVFDDIAARIITRNFIEPTENLEEHYHQYWNSIYPEISIQSMAAPFCQLAEEPFWNLVPQPGQTLASDFTADSLDDLRKQVLGARFCEDLFPLLVMETHREKLRAVLQNSICQLL